jgi:acyl CoA:acetate/3-ketoacid CoA transferase
MPLPKPERNARIMELREQGKTMNQIVQQLFIDGYGWVSVQRVQYIVRRESIAKIMPLHEAGVSVAEIAAQLGLPEDIIKREQEKASE